MNNIKGTTERNRLKESDKINQESVYSVWTEITSKTSTLKPIKKVNSKIDRTLF